MGGDSEPPNLRRFLPGARRARATMKQLLIVGLTAALAFLGLTTTTAAQAAETSFISTWRTTNTSAGSSGASQVRLPLISGGTYNFTVDWGVCQTDTIPSDNQAHVTHTY